MRDWRIERCALREKVRKWLFQKNRAWGPSDMRITNEKGWETILEKIDSSRTERSLAIGTRLSVVSLAFLFVSILVESFQVSVFVFRLFYLCFPLSSRGALRSVVGSIPSWEFILTLNFKKSFCAQSAVLFSTFVQNKICAFIKSQGSTQVM